MLKWKVASRQNVGEGVDGTAMTVGVPSAVQELQQCLASASVDLCRISDKGVQLLANMGALPAEQQDQAKDVVATVLGLKTQFDLMQSQVLQLMELHRPPASQAALQAKDQADAIPREQQQQPQCGSCAAELGAQCVRRCISCLAARSPDFGLSRSFNGQPARQSSLEVSGNGKSWPTWQPPASASPPSCLRQGDTVIPAEKGALWHSRADAAGQYTSLLVQEAKNGSSSSGISSRDAADDCTTIRSSANGSLLPMADSDDQMSFMSGWSDSSKETPSTGDSSSQCLVSQDKPTQLNRACRARAISDFVESERKYCTVLSTIMKDYGESTYARNNVADQETRHIFPTSLKNVYEFHRRSLTLLEKRIATLREVDILGDIFARFTESIDRVSVFSEYKDYIENFPVALSSLRRLQKSSSEFRKWIKRCRRSSVLVLDLANLLLIPVCRVPGYVTVLQQLLQFTEPEHPDAFHLRWCLPKFEKIASDLSQTIARCISMAKYSLSDDGPADDTMIQEESMSYRWNTPGRTGSEDDMLVRCKDGEERSAAEELVVLSAVAATEGARIAGGGYQRSYASQSTLNGLVTLPRKQQRGPATRTTQHSNAHPEGSSASESHLRNVKVSPQGNSYCVVSSSTLPRQHRLTNTHPSMEENGALPTRSTGVSYSQAPLRDKAQVSRQQHHVSQFDLRPHEIQSPASKSAIHKWMHSSQPDLLHSKCGSSMHSLVAGGTTENSKQSAREDGGGEGKSGHKRKGFGALLRFFFGKKLLQKTKTTIGKKGSAECSTNPSPLFSARLQNSMSVANGATVVSDASYATPALERFRQLSDSGGGGMYASGGSGNAWLQDVEQPDGGSGSAISVPQPGKDCLI